MINVGDQVWFNDVLDGSRIEGVVIAIGTVQNKKSYHVQIDNCVFICSRVSRV
jgi:hypothetical protein